jgi:uncharacterized membrane protein
MTHRPVRKRVQWSLQLLVALPIFFAVIFAVLRWRGHVTTAFVMLIPVFAGLVVGGIVWLAHLTDRRG